MLHAGGHNPDFVLLGEDGAELERHALNALTTQEIHDLVGVQIFSCSSENSFVRSPGSTTIHVFNASGLSLHFLRCHLVTSKGMVRKTPEAMALEAEERAVKEATERAAEVIVARVALVSA